MKKEKINSIQLGAIMSMLMISSFLGIGMYSIIKIAHIDSYLSLVIAAFIGIIILKIMQKIFDYKKELTISEKIDDLYGKIIGNIIKIILIICIFFISTVLMYNISNFITSQFLKDTPTFLITIVFGIIIYIVNVKGIEVMSRTILILYIMCIFLFTFSIIGIWSKFDISNLKPFLEYGIEKPLKGSIYNILLNVVPIFFILIIPKKNIIKNEKTNKILSFFYIFSAAIKTTLIIITIGVLGIKLVSIYQYPEYMVMKKISVFDFIDRIENILTIQWFYGIFSSISFYVYYISNTIKKNNTNKKVIASIVILIIFLSNIIFKNNIIFNNFTYKFLPGIMSIILVIHIITFIKIIIHKKNT